MDASRYKEALHEIVTLLGPYRVCDCPCEGLAEEAAEALQVARAALGLAAIPPRYM